MPYNEFRGFVSDGGIIRDKKGQEVRTMAYQAYLHFAQNLYNHLEDGDISVSRLAAGGFTLKPENENGRYFFDYYKKRGSYPDLGDVTGLASQFIETGLYDNDKLLAPENAMSLNAIFARDKTADFMVRAQQAIANNQCGSGSITGLGIRARLADLFLSRRRLA